MQRWRRSIQNNYSLRPTTSSCKPLWESFICLDRGRSFHSNKRLLSIAQNSSFVLYNTFQKLRIWCSCSRRRYIAIVLEMDLYICLVGRSQRTKRTPASNLSPLQCLDEMPDELSLKTSLHPSPQITVLKQTQYAYRWVLIASMSHLLRIWRKKAFAFPSWRYFQ